MVIRVGPDRQQIVRADRLQISRIRRLRHTRKDRWMPRMLVRQMICDGYDPDGIQRIVPNAVRARMVRRGFNHRRRQAHYSPNSAATLQSFLT